MSNNNGSLLILGILGLIFLGSGKRDKYGSVGGYPRGYKSAVTRTQRQYGAGEDAEIPAIQDKIEQANTSRSRQGASARAHYRQSTGKNLAPMGSTVMDFSKTLRDTKRDLKMGQLKASTRRIPAVQDRIESRRY